MANQPQATKREQKGKLKVGIYMSWGEKLWYVCDIGYDEDDRLIALLEDCYTEQLKWVPVRFFKSGMKEVKLQEC